MRFKPPTMLRKRSVRGLLAAGAVVAAVGGMALAQAAPALADPQPTLVAVGSDTIQDVWNAFTNGTPADSAAGIAAVPAALGVRRGRLVQRDQPGDRRDQREHHPARRLGRCRTASFPTRPPRSRWRPATAASPARTAPARASRRCGSRSTRPAPTPARPSPRDPGLGCVDIARSSSTVDTTDNNPAVDIQFVPFAIDAVTGATGPASCTPSTNCPSFTADLGNGTTKAVTTVASTLGSDIGTATLAQISALYNCTADQDRQHHLLAAGAGPDRPGRRHGDRPVRAAARLGHPLVLGGHLGRQLPRQRSRRHLRQRPHHRGRAGVGQRRRRQRPGRGARRHRRVHRPGRLRPVLHRPVHLAAEPDPQPARPRRGPAGHQRRSPRSSPRGRPPAG